MRTDRMVGPDGKLRFAPRLFLLALVLGLVVGLGSAKAQVGSDRYASMVIDSQTGQIISSANADDYRFPASLTKMMTIYLVFEAIRDGRLSFNDAIEMSPWAASMPPTKMGIPPGGTLTVDEALLSLVTKSANDVAAALGERLGGSEDRFAELMTQRARSLGMTHTTFRNASGLPDWGQVTTARDMVILARHLIQDFPQYYHLFSTPYFQFHGRTVLNHQTLLRTYAGADGLKTGYTEASGYNVVVSAMRGNVRLIGVVLGAGSGGERDAHMASLLDEGFQRMGVAPVEMARHEPAYHLPFVSTAHAAPMPVYAEVPVRAFRPVVHERVTVSRGRRVFVPTFMTAPRAPLPPAYAPAPIRSRGPSRVRREPRAEGPRLHTAERATRPSPAPPRARVAVGSREPRRG